jgi:alpha-glucosidase
MLLSGLAIAHLAMAQASFISEDKVAVFYPAHYDASQHEPSPIFEHEPAALLPLPADWKVRAAFSERGGKQVATIPLEQGVDLYGTGEVTGPLRRNGRTISLWNVDTPAYSVDGGSHLYQSHPWVMGIRPDGSAFGIIADNTWKQSIRTSDREVVFESEGPAFRVVVIERESPKALMQALVDLTGKMELPPLWSLGYQQCRFSYHPDTRVMEIADLLRQHQIPSDVIWMDIHYMDGYRVFTFDPKEFSDPKGLNDYLHSKNFKAVYMIDPGVKAEQGYFVDDQGMAGDYYIKDKDGKPFVAPVWPGPCHFPDFTRPEVRTWWATLYPKYMATGIDGVWNDMNEPTAFECPQNIMPADNRHGGGDGWTAGNHLRYHNMYGMQMVRASRQGLLLSNPQKRPFILSRSNFLGGHRYAATWTGDNLSSPEQMKLSVPMTLTLGLSGQPFNGPDIGGFCENTTAELLADWTAIGVFFPFVRNHTIDGSINQEPWAFTPEVLNSCRTAIERRYLLMPYIYTLFREASIDGMPVMRPVFMADAKDLSLRGEDQAFLLGGDLMVIPRWAEKVAHPDNGSWQVVNLSSLHSPLSTLHSDKYQAELRQRPGSIIPLANLAQSTTEMRTDSLTLLVCLDGEGKAVGELYEDEGDGFKYREGQYRMNRFEASLEKKMLTLSLLQTDGKMQQPQQRWLRIAYVKDGRVQYSAWQEGMQATMKIKK